MPACPGQQADNAALGLQNADGSGYSQYQHVMEAFGAHQATLNVSSYLQVWNEPDLTTRFSTRDPNSATFFAGNSEDYTELYLAANNGLRVCSSTRCAPAGLQACAA